jgi:sulfide dehydrogenase cytochrome subunit
MENIMKKMLILGMLGCSTAFAQPNGELLASQCFQCHGFNGNSLGEIDSIAGKSASDLYGDLKEFKTNGKKDIMSLQSRLYTDNELWAIANYFSTLPGSGSND